MTQLVLLLRGKSEGERRRTLPRSQSKLETLYVMGTLLGTSVSLVVIFFSFSAILVP